MLGNRPGWAIALLLAAGFALAFRELVAVNRLTPPTPAAARAERPLATEVPASAVMAFDLPGDGHALYRQAIDAVLREPGRYAGLETATDADAVERSPAVAALLAAAGRRGDPLGDPAARAVYDPPTDELDALLAAARCAAHAAALRAPADPARAAELWQAQFALGVKVFEARVRYAEAAAGLALAADAVSALSDLATRSGDARRAARLATYQRSVAGLVAQRINSVWQAIGPVDPDAIAAHAGDVFTLAGPATPDRMWRVEAVLALGRHRFNLDRPADRLAVPRRLDEIEHGETDPAVLTAVRAAKALTVAQFRTLR